MKPSVSGDIEFLQALLKRGFVHIPRMLFDYTVDLQLDYDTIGRLFALLACLGGPSESPYNAYAISKKNHPRDYEQLRTLVIDLEQKDIVRVERGGDDITFSFTPLYSRVRANWEHYREQHENEITPTAIPHVIGQIEKLIGRPLSDREVKESLEWADDYGFNDGLVLAVWREGMSQGVTRLNYLKQIALSWFEGGVRTEEEIEALAQRHRKAVGKHKAIIQYLGLKRLSGAEQALIEKWTSEWGFSNEVVLRACAEAAGSNNPLQYINKVLEVWHDQGVKSVADVERLLTEHRRRMPQRETETPAGKGKKGTTGSNVFLRRDKKDEKYYDHVYKPFGE